MSKLNRKNQDKKLDLKHKFLSYVKSFAKILCFCTILLLVLSYTDKVFALKNEDGLYDMIKFYDLENNTVDVLVLGSSHAFVDINTGVLWEEAGMTAYVLGGGVQPMWNTYYYLKEALKTQTPELIVLEAYTTVFAQEYNDDARITSNTFGMKWSRDKVAAIKTSSPEERWSEFLLSYCQYHTRYTELTRADFMANKGDIQYENRKGFWQLMSTKAFNIPDVSKVSERIDMTGKTEEYYRKTIELALNNKIPLLIVISPYAGITARDQAVFNKASDIAAEYGVPFVNYNLLYEEIGLDFAQDCADKGHLNYRGNIKYTNTLCDYISENYNIPDRRGDVKYESWEANARYLTASVTNQELVESTNLPEIISKLQNSNYTVIVSVDGNCTTKDDKLYDLFESLGLGHDGDNGIWYIMDQVGIHYFSGTDESEKYMRPDYHDVKMQRVFDNNSQTYINNVWFDNISCKKVQNGVNIVVYSNVTQTLADCFGINMDKGYIIVR